MDAAAVRIPDFFIASLNSTYAPEDVERIVAGSTVRRATSLRVNTLRATWEDATAALDEAGIAWEQVPWFRDALQLPSATPRDLWQLPLYENGGIYLQSLSSMLPPLALDLGISQDILDMCAAPGGKTTEMAALTARMADKSQRAHITACEMHLPRAEKLEYNLEKQGATNVMVMKTDARKLDSFFSFDRVLLDAPCSGSGTLRATDPKMPKRFTQALVDKSRKSQAALLDKALSVVKPGGAVVYSTCSVLKSENEDIVTAALARAKKKGAYRIEPITWLDVAAPCEGTSSPNAPELAAKPAGAEAACSNSPELTEFCAKSVAQNSARAELATTSAPAATCPTDGATGAAGPFAELPLLPVTLENTLCVCPTDRYEGFFMARIRRLA